MGAAAPGKIVDVVDLDRDNFRRWFIDQARERKGLSALGKIQRRYDLDKGLDQLAAQVRQSIDVDRIYRLLGLQ